MDAYTSKETTLRDFLRVIFTHKIVFVILPIAIIAPVFVSLEFKTPVYQSQVKMLVRGAKESEVDYYKGIIVSRNLILDHTELVKSRLVIERVVKALRLYERPVDYEKQYASRLKAALIDYRLKNFNLRLKEMTPEQKQAFLFNSAMGKLGGSIVAMPLRDTSLFTITVRDFSPVAASVIANAVSRSYVIFDLEQQIAELQLKYGERHSTVIQLKNYIEKLKKTLDGSPLHAIEAIGPASVKIIEQAQSSGQTKSFQRNILFIFAFFASILFGVILTFGFEYLDTTFRSPKDVKTFLNIPFLGSIPKRKSKDKLLIGDANSATTNYSRAYQNLSDQIYILMKDKNLKSLLITDAEGSEVTTAVIANLGVYLAHKTGYRVLIIDANLRNPSVSKIFSIFVSPGLVNVLEEKIPFEDAIQNLGSHLHVLPAGEAVSNPVILLDSSMMSNVMRKAKEQYEIVLINCLDLKNFTDAVVFSSLTDGTVLVINQGEVKQRVAKSAIAPLEQKKINIVGVILNNRTYVVPKIIYDLT